MVQGYYTLDEAARILGTSPDELKSMSKRGQLRSFQDRGTLRFRTQDVEELARQRGLGSAPDLPLGEAPKAKPADSPPRAPGKPAEETFDFALDLGDEPAHVPVGQEAPGSRKGGSKRGGPETPPPKPGSDSDVRLVPEGSQLDFQVAGDSNVRMVDEAGPKSAPPAPKGKSGVHPDSGVRLVDVGSDSDVKIVDAGPEDVPLGHKPPKSASDSDIRLDLGDTGRPGKGGDDSLLTEEIDLDAEIQKAEEAARAKGSDPEMRTAKPRPPEFPKTSPFELSETGLHPDKPAQPAAPPPAAKAGRAKESDLVRTPGEGTDSSGDFDLAPEKKDPSSDFDLTPAAQSPLEGSDEFQLELTDDEVGLGELPPAKGSGTGINLGRPADSGISLEQEGGPGSDSVEFELSLDAEATPKPAPASDADSDSEFELTLDESGGLAPLEEEAPASEDEKDIFETDFEVPALEEESGSEAVAVEGADTDLESSDFDIALSDQDMATEDESGSQVVALDEEEEAEAGARTVQRPAARRGAGEGFDELAEGEEEPAAEVEEEVEEEEAEPVAVAEAAPAEWGPVPALVMLPCVIVLVLVGLMGFELVQGLGGYRQPGPLTQQISKILNIKGPPG